MGGLLRSILQMPAIQQAGTAMFQGLGALILNAINDPKKLRNIASNLQQNPQAFVGADTSGRPYHHAHRNARDG
jgi:hypothetical protein